MADLNDTQADYEQIWRDKPKPPNLAELDGLEREIADWPALPTSCKTMEHGACEHIEVLGDNLRLLLDLVGRMGEALDLGKSVTWAGEIGSAKRVAHRAMADALIDYRRAKGE